MVIETLGIFRFVSIPSRRVGDLEDYWSECELCEFPSPQDGSETDDGKVVVKVDAEFPSPQGGSETTTSTPMIPH